MFGLLLFSVGYMDQSDTKIRHTLPTKVCETKKLKKKKKS